MKNNNPVFMAIKVGSKSEESAYKYYKGVGAFNIIAVNPNKNEMKELLGREVAEEPEYKSKTEEGKDQVRLTFYAKTSAESKVNNGIDLRVPITFVLTKDYRMGRTSGKVQIIDKYGRTAWASKEEFQSKAIPMYKSGPANISADYRAAYQGEEALVNFLIQWLNIPNPADYKNGKWVMKDNPEDSEVSINMEALFKGDISEFKELVKLAAPYVVKCAVGVRTTEEGKMYQSVFTRKFLKNAVSDYGSLDSEIADFQASGGAVNVEYDTSTLHEHKVEATTFSEDTTGSSPASDFAPSTDLPWS